MFELNQIADIFYRAAMFIGGLLCHQMPARSPHIGEIQMPLCWRCVGITIGAAAFFLWLVFCKRQPSLILSCALASLMLLDVLTAMSGLWNGDNTIRIVTGLLWGAFAMNIVLYIFSFINNRLTDNSFADFIGGGDGRQL